MCRFDSGPRYHIYESHRFRAVGLFYWVGFLDSSRDNVNIDPVNYQFGTF